MNKKGFVPPIVVFFIDVVFVICWIFFLSEMLTISGNMMIASGATGFEAFFYGNLNLFVFFCFLIFNAAALRSG